jgi:hypothetical protein
LVDAQILQQSEPPINPQPFPMTHESEVGGLFPT